MFYRLLLFSLSITSIVSLGQEAKTYARVKILQYDSTIKPYDNPETVDSKPAKEFNFFTQKLQLQNPKEFDTTGHSKLPTVDVYRDVVNSELISVEIHYDSFSTVNHTINSEQETIDGRRVYGARLNDTISSNYYLKSIEFRINNKVITRQNFEPYIFNTKFYSLCKVFGKDILYATFGLDEGIESGFILFSKEGICFYMSSHPAYLSEPIGHDILNKTGKQFGYSSKFEGGTSSALDYILLSWRLHEESKWREYWELNRTTNLSFVKDNDMSYMLKSDSVYGEYGTFDKKKFLLHMNSILKDKNNPFLYHVKGVYKLDDNISFVEGDFAIKYVYPYDDEFSHPFDQHKIVRKNLVITGDFTLRENSNQKVSGVFKGAWKLNIWSDHDSYLSHSTPLYYFFKEFSAAFNPYKNPTLKICSWQSVNSGKLENDVEMKIFLEKNVKWWVK